MTNGGGMNRTIPGSSGDWDVNAMLDALLNRLERALEDAGTGAEGMPLRVVEDKLTERLRADLPGIRFTGQDIRAWAAQISS